MDNDMRKFYTLVFAVTTLFFSQLGLADTAAAGAAVVPTPYDESADASANIQAALTQAKATKKDVLLIFGANWCKDCVELDKSLKGRSAALMQKKFIVVKINVGQFDKNLELANQYGNPIKKGIPAAVLLAPDKQILFATHGGELADARHMGDQGIYDFFNKLTETSHN